MLGVMTAASAPSASIEAAPCWSPTSRPKLANGTPVHSEALRRPRMPGTVFIVGFRHSVPEHSMKWVRETEGKRFRSAIRYFFGRSTMPWMKSACRIGSIVGKPA